jgi:hypothetical protein
LFRFLSAYTFKTNRAKFRASERIARHASKTMGEGKEADQGLSLTTLSGLVLTEKAEQLFNDMV